jgi:hypothetical protein
VTLKKLHEVLGAESDFTKLPRQLSFKLSANLEYLKSLKPYYTLPTEKLYEEFGARDTNKQLILKEGVPMLADAVGFNKAVEDVLASEITLYPPYPLSRTELAGIPLSPSTLKIIKCFLSI